MSEPKRMGYVVYFDGMAWPSVSEELGDLEWRLRYAEPTRGDILKAASVLSAYAALIAKTERDRRYVVRMVRQLSAGPSTPPNAEPPSPSGLPDTGGPQ